MTTILLIIFCFVAVIVPKAGSETVWDVPLSLNKLRHYFDAIKVDDQRLVVSFRKEPPSSQFLCELDGKILGIGDFVQTTSVPLGSTFEISIPSVAGELKA